MRADDVADKIILGFYLARVFPEQQLWPGYWPGEELGGREKVPI